MDGFGERIGMFLPQALVRAQIRRWITLGTMVFSWIQISAANKLQLLENYASPPTNFPTRNHSR
jgi:hypothetical protein